MYANKIYLCFMIVLLYSCLAIVYKDRTDNSNMSAECFITFIE